MSDNKFFQSKAHHAFSTMQPGYQTFSNTFTVEDLYRAFKERLAHETKVDAEIKATLAECDVARVDEVISDLVSIEHMHSRRGEFLLSETCYSAARLMREAYRPKVK